jgi:hypothetical protein
MYEHGDAVMKVMVWYVTKGDELAVNTKRKH